MFRSEELFNQAQKWIPGGVNSPVRAFKSVDGQPPFIRSAKGAKIIDEDGNAYIDYVGSWGPMIVGHAHPEVVKAIKKAAESGSSFGAPTQAEVRLAKKIINMVPSIEMVRLVNSGTEATMSTLRLARAVTRRDAILKFEGCYHGHADSLLVAAGSGAATFGVPSSPGVTAGTAKDTLTVPFNDLDAVENCFKQNPDKIAAVIVEPVAGNMGCVPPKEGFLEGLRELTQQYGALLIFDEVMTGFRVAAGGAQEAYNIDPDLTALGKVIGGGLPIGAYGGKKEFMEQISPSGPVYQAGTLSGNPLATAAGLATLNILSQPKFYSTLEKQSKKLLEGLHTILKEAHIPHLYTRKGSMFSIFFTEQETLENFTQVSQCDGERFKRWFHAMLQEGVNLAPSAFEAGFVSLAHNNKVIRKTLKAAKRAVKKL
ncbi:glutamate-1-semialdehyde 2,1-aminomutase [Magnetococcales bacterium HHB-1]